MFKENNEVYEFKVEAKKAIAITIGVTSFLFLSRYFMGAKKMDTAWRNAINCCLLANPNLKPLLENAAKRALEIRKV